MSQLHFSDGPEKSTGVLEGRPGVELYRVGRCFCESVGSISRPLEIVPALDSVRKQCGLRLFAIWIVPHHPEDFSAWKLDETVFYNPQYEYLATAVQRTNLARWPADWYLEPQRCDRTTLGVRTGRLPACARGERPSGPFAGLVPSR